MPDSASRRHSRDAGTGAWLAFVCSAGGEAERFDAAWAHTTGQTLDEARGWGWTAAVHPDDRPQLLAGWKGAVQSSTPYDVELRLRLRGGAFGRFQLRAHPMTDASGRTAAWCGVCIDVDHSRQETQDLQAKTRSILDTAIEGIVTIDESGIVDSFNPAAERIFGFAAHEVVGRNVSMLMPEPDRSRHDGYIEHYLRTGEKRIIGIGRQVQGRRKDGTSVPIELAVSEFEYGGARFFTGLIRDVSEQMQAIEALRREHDFNESVIETAQAIILILDPQARIARINSFMESLSGYTRREVEGRNWFDLFIPRRHQQRIRQVFQHVVAGERIHGNVNPIVTKSGEEREIAWWGKALRNEAGEVTGVLNVGHDLTELKGAQQRALQAERLAGIGQMMTGLAHESRNALQRVQACLDMLELDLNRQPELLNLTGRARRAVEELNRLYEEVRNYAAPIKLDLRECLLSRVWEQAWKHLQEVSHDKRIEFYANADSADLRSRLDVARIEQVFRNILENAVAVCPDLGEIVIDCADTELNGRSAVRVSVRDNGPGLTTEQLQNILEPFYTTKTKGTGLGMAIAKRIVEAHGGTIEARNAAPDGAEIIVTLPREPE